MGTFNFIIVTISYCLADVVILLWGKRRYSVIIKKTSHASVAPAGDNWRIAITATTDDVTIAANADITSSSVTKKNRLANYTWTSCPKDDVHVENWHENDFTVDLALYRYAQNKRWHRFVCTLFFIRYYIVTILLWYYAIRTCTCHIVLLVLHMQRTRQRYSVTAHDTPSRYTIHQIVTIVVYPGTSHSRWHGIIGRKTQRCRSKCPGGGYACRQDVEKKIAVTRGVECTIYCRQTAAVQYSYTFNASAYRLYIHIWFIYLTPLITCVYIKN